MTCRAILLALTLCLFSAMTCGRAAAADGDQLFSAANEAYSRGDYQRAIALYEEVQPTVGYSPHLLYNLGNSYARAGQTGRAVLAYERGLRLAPDDPDLQGSLQLLRRDKGLFSDPPQGWRPMELLSLDRWALLALAALVAMATWQLLALWKARLRRGRLPASLCCLLVMTLAATAAAVRHRSFNPSVVIAADARLLLSPFPSSASLGQLQEGRLVRVEKTHGEYLYVALESGRRGWIDKRQIEAVVK